jgi:glutathione peroxidase-family protein
MPAIATTTRSRCHFRLGWRATLGIVLLSLCLPALATSARAPEFTHTRAENWLNGGPLTLAELRGKVLLIDFWTFDCWNCYRSFPWLNAVEARYQEQGLQVVGIHSPEFEHEHERAAVRRKIEEFGLRHPVMLDNDFSYWRAMNNRYWPAFYLLDRQGNIRGRYIGETHQGSQQAEQIETLLRELLEE